MIDPAKRKVQVYEHSWGSDGKPYVKGPGRGTGYDSGTLYPEMRLSSEADAKAAALIANQAYQEGRDSLRREFLNLLGIGIQNR